MDKDCIFCKIVKNEIPSNKIYEDMNFLVFLDISPLGPGHAQVIPKKHYRYVWDVPDAGRYFEIVKKIALAQKRAFGADIVRSQIYGEEVFHAHIWVWPEVPGNATDFVVNKQKLIDELNKEENQI